MKTLYAYRNADADDSRFTVTKVVQNEVIHDDTYGDIVITEGNYIMEQVAGAMKGRKFGLSAADLKTGYKQVKK